MRPSRSSITYLLMLFSLTLLGQAQVDATTATTALQRTFNSLLPGNTSVDEFEVTESNAIFTISGELPLSNSTSMALSGNFETEDWEAGEVTINGNIYTTTVGSILSVLGADNLNIPAGFRNTEISNLQVTVSPTDETMTTSFFTNIGKVVLDSSADGFLFGLSPNDNVLHSLTGVSGLINGFSFVYSSFSDEEDQKTTAYINEHLAMNEVPAKNGLNAYWTGQLPADLKRFLSFLPTRYLNHEMTFAADGTIGGAPEIPTMTFSFAETYSSFPLTFDGLELTLDPINASIGVGGDITCNFGAGVPELGFASALTATVSPAALSGKLTLDRVGNSSGTVWDPAFGIPGIKITDLFVGASVSNRAGASGSIGGTADLFGFESSLKITSSNSQWSLSGELEEIHIPNKDAPFFSLSGNDDSENPTFTLGSNLAGKLEGKVVLLGLEAESDINISPTGLSCTTSGDLFGVAAATLTMSAENFTNFDDTEFNLSGSITQDLTSGIKRYVRNNLSDEVALIVGAALSSFSIDEVGIEATSKLTDIGSSAVTLAVDVTLIGFDVPEIPVTISIQDLQDLPGLVEKIGEEIVDELEDEAGDFFGAFADFAGDQVNAFADFAEENGMKLINATDEGLEELGEFLEDGLDFAEDTWNSLFGNEKVNRVASPKPDNGNRSIGLTPLSIFEFEVTLLDMKAMADIASGEGDELELYGSISAIPYNMMANSEANEYLFHNCSDEDRDYSEGVYRSINSKKTFWVPECNLGTAQLNIVVRLKDRDPSGNADEIINGTKSLNIIDVPRDEGALASPRVFTIRAGEEGHRVEVRFLLQWKPNYLGVPANLPDGYYYIQNDSNDNYLDANNGRGENLVGHSPMLDKDSQLWLLTNTSAGMYTIQDVTTSRFITGSGTGWGRDLLGVGGTSKEWFVAEGPNGTYSIREVSTGKFMDIFANPHSSLQGLVSVKQHDIGSRPRTLQWKITPLDPKIIGVGTNHQLYARATLNSKWNAIPNSGDIVAVSFMNDGTILGVGTDSQLRTRSTLYSEWKVVPNAHGFKSVTQLDDGTILGVGVDNQLWKRSSLIYNGQLVDNSGPVVWVTQMKDGNILAAAGGKLKTRQALDSDWVLAPNKGGNVRAVAQLNDGLIIGLGTNDKRLWTRKSFDAGWELLAVNNPYNSCIGLATNLAAPSCSDGIQNQGEIGIDCGGLNCAPCITCDDGIQNQGETEVDCGGPNCEPCPTCNDGIQNQWETAIDCGGPNCDPCSTCDDDIQNQGETAIDCGGPCAPCSTCDDGIQNQGETQVDCGGPNCEPCPFDPNYYYRITNRWQGDGKSLDIINNDTDDTPILANTGNYTGQFWRITRTPEGYYRLNTQWQGEGKSLDVAGTQPVLARTDGESRQSWFILPSESEGYFIIANKTDDPRKHLDIINDGNNNKPVLTYFGNYLGQYWKFTKLHPVNP